MAASDIRDVLSTCHNLFDQPGQADVPGGTRSTITGRPPLRTISSPPVYRLATRRCYTARLDCHRRGHRRAAGAGCATRPPGSPCGARDGEPDICVNCYGSPPRSARCADGCVRAPSPRATGRSARAAPRARRPPALGAATTTYLRSAGTRIPYANRATLPRRAAGDDAPSAVTIGGWSPHPDPMSAPALTAPACPLPTPAPTAACRISCMRRELRAVQPPGAGLPNCCATGPDTSRPS